MKINYFGKFADIEKIVKKSVHSDLRNNKLQEQPLLSGTNGEGKKEGVSIASSGESRTVGIPLQHAGSYITNITNCENLLSGLDKSESPHLEPQSATSLTFIEPPVIKPEPALQESVKEATLPIPVIVKATRGIKGRGYVQQEPENNISKINQLVEKAGRSHNIDTSLGMAIISAESSFNAKAVSKDGAETKGLFQLKDSTGLGLMARLDKDLKEYKPFEPQLNVELGVSYLRYLHDVFSQETVLRSNLKTVPAKNSSSLEKMAIAAFNAGEGRVAAAQERARRSGKDPSEFGNIVQFLPPVTRNYVDKVLKYRDEFTTRPTV